MGKEHNSHLPSRTYKKVRRLLERIHEFVGRKKLLQISIYATCGDPIAKSTSTYAKNNFRRVLSHHLLSLWRVWNERGHVSVFQSSYVTIR